MKPYYDSDNIKVYNGHTLSVLKEIPTESVQSVCTSPPYWGLRDYSTEPLIWDGDENCVHEWVEEIKKIVGGHSGGIESSGLFCSKESIEKKAKGTGSNKNNKYAFCQKCKAWKGSLGLEPTPELFVNHLVEIFREVKRVLRDDGTCWLNLGDTYSGSRGHGSQCDNKAAGKYKKEFTKYKNPNRETGGVLKAKDLVGIPWRVAFALQADGWYLRQDIIWQKPSCIPESVKDRCTKSHEYRKRSVQKRERA
jgi:DNA modification methylase